MADLGLSVEEFAPGGPVRSYRVTHGDDAWTVSITPRDSFAVIHVSAD